MFNLLPIPFKLKVTYCFFFFFVNYKLRITFILEWFCECVICEIFFSKNSKAGQLGFFPKSENESFINFYEIWKTNVRRLHYIIIVEQTDKSLLTRTSRKMLEFLSTHYDAKYNSCQTVTYNIFCDYSCHPKSSRYYFISNKLLEEIVSHIYRYY